MTTARLATPEEVTHWDELITHNPSGGNVFQGQAFGAAKAGQGWKLRHIVYQMPSGANVATLYLTRRISLIGDLWYAPKGPGVTNRADFESILAANHQLAKDSRIFAFKLDPEVPHSEGLPAGLVKTHNVQPNADTVIVDLSPSEDEVLASFRQRARRAIRQAQAAGVQVKAVEASTQNYRYMYNLYKNTGKRTGFHVRSFAYHQKLWQLWVGSGQGQLFFAYHNGQLVAAAFVAYLGKKGLYKDGASDRASLNSGGAHLLQWEAMRWLKQRGVTSYDLHGTPPPEELENTQHRFYGLGLFKTSFTDQVTQFMGTVDQVIKPKAYRRWEKLGHRLAQSLEYRLRNRTFY